MAVENPVNKAHPRGTSLGVASNAMQQHHILHHVSHKANPADSHARGWGPTPCALASSASSGHSTPPATGSCKHGNAAANSIKSKCPAGPPPVRSAPGAGRAACKAAESAEGRAGGPSRPLWPAPVGPTGVRAPAGHGRGAAREGRAGRVAEPGIEPDTRPGGGARRRSEGRAQSPSGALFLGRPATCTYMM